MNILYNFVEIIATFFEGFMIAEFLRSIFSQVIGKKYLKYNVWFGVIYMVCIRVLNMSAIFSYVTLLFATIIISIYATSIYKKKVIVSISIASFYVLCLTVHGLSCLAFLSGLKNTGELYEAVLYQNGIERILFIVVVQSMWVMTCILVKYLFKKLQIHYDFGYKSIAVIAMGTIGIVFLTNQTLNSFNVHLTYAWLLVITIIVLIVFYMYAKTIDRENKAKLQMSDMRNSLLEEKYQSIKEIYTNNAKAYHDFNNHLNILNNLLEEGNIDSAKNYIAEIGEPIRKLSNFTWTGNEIIDVVINFEIDKMNAKNIVYDIDVNVLKDMNINTKDMGILVGNLLDNAIEATEKIDGAGKIRFVMKQIQQFLNIKITNPCEENFAFSGIYPETTKEEKGLHGWGLKNVMDIVEKYEGSFNCQSNGGIFEVSILLLNNEDELQ